MLSNKMYSLYKYINFKKIAYTDFFTTPTKHLFLKKVGYKTPFNTKLKIVNTCILTGRKKSVFNKHKLNRHFIRDKKKNLFDYWQIKSW